MSTATNTPEKFLAAGLLAVLVTAVFFGTIAASAGSRSAAVGDAVLMAQNGSAGQPAA